MACTVSCGHAYGNMVPSHSQTAFFAKSSLGTRHGVVCLQDLTSKLLVAPLYAICMCIPTIIRGDLVGPLPLNILFIYVPLCRLYICVYTHHTNTFNNLHLHCNTSSSYMYYLMMFIPTNKK